MKPTLPLIASFIWATTTSPNPLPPRPQPQPLPVRPELPRLIIYHQTTHDNLNRPISLLPLIHTQHIALTHLVIAAIHIHAANANDNDTGTDTGTDTSNGTIHLNDHPPTHPRYATLRAEARLLQAAGVKVLGMVGGAARGSFARGTLDGGHGSGNSNSHSNSSNSGDEAFERAYALLRGVVDGYGLDGVDLDVEEAMTLGGAVRLVRRLRGDYGEGFVVSFAPVATALLGGSNLSGFRYGELERVVGGEVGFYNAQFYNGFGGAGDAVLFDGIVKRGWAPERIVVGQLTSPANGAGFVRHEELERTVAALRKRYGEIGGVAGWEYFNGAPGGLGRPWEWAESMTRILRPGKQPALRITKEGAEKLNEAWIESATARDEGGVETAERWVGLVPNVDYMSMVNE